MVAKAFVLLTVVSAAVGRTFNVTPASLAGTGSLSWAILEANANDGADEIVFLTGGTQPWTILVDSVLPLVVDTTIFRCGDCAANNVTVTLDGGYDRYAARASSPFDGFSGLVLAGHNHSIVMGIRLVRFRGHGLWMQGNNHTFLGVATLHNGLDGMRGDGADWRVLWCVSSGNGGNGVFSEGQTAMVNKSYLGVTEDGLGALGNNLAGISIKGDDALVTACVVSANGVDGIRTYGARVTVRGCLVGLDAKGTIALGNMLAGLMSTGDDAVVGPGNTFSGNKLDGAIFFGDRLVFKGNIIGFDVTGMVPLGNHDDGMQVEGADALVGGDAPQDRNVAGCNKFDGFYITGPRGIVRGNWAGLDATGNTSCANLDFGIDGDGDFPLIENNVASGNGQSGISVVGNSAIIRMNFVGVSAEGILALPNNEHGINAVGDDASIEGNLVSGNAANGIVSSGANVVIFNNTVGLTVGGDVALPNSENGIDTRGHTPTLKLNCVAGNLGTGIFVAGSRALLADNVVGVDATGSFAIPNADNGLDLRGAWATVLGNVFSGNNANGVSVAGARVMMQRNAVGTARDQVTSIPNRLNGVLLLPTATFALIGGDDVVAGNVLSGNVMFGLFNMASYTRLTYNAIGGAGAAAATARGAQTTDMPSGHGGTGNLMGGLFSDESAGWLTAVGNSFSDNAGDGALIQGRRAVLQSNTFINNSGDGVLLVGFNATVYGNHIVSNGGAGVRVVAMNCNVSLNSIGASSDMLSASLEWGNRGGGIIVAGASAVLTDNVICANLKGGLFLLPSAENAVVTNCRVGVAVNGEPLVGNNVVGIGVQAPFALLVDNVVAMTSGVGIVLNVAEKKPVYLLHNLIFLNSDQGLVNLQPALVQPIQLFLTPNRNEFWASVLAPAGETEFVVDIFGNTDTDSSSEGHVLLATLGAFGVPANAAASTSFFRNLRGFGLQNDTSAVTAIVTFLKSGSSVFSRPVVPLSDFNACRLCRCMNTTVNCRNLGLAFIPMGIPLNTTDLDLSGNMLRGLSLETWAAVLALPALVVLNVSDTKLATLSAWDWLPPVLTLRVLFLSHNTLSALPDLGRLCPGLEKLLLEADSLLPTTMTSSLFAGLRALKELSLASSALEFLPDGVFDHLSLLVTLDLGGNRLASISASVFSAKLSRLNFLSVAQVAADAQSMAVRGTVNVSQLSALQGMFWVSDVCADGFYGVGQAVCLRCPPGTYTAAGDTKGRSSCIACAAGTTDVDTHAQTPCVPCPAGTYAPEGSSGECVPCAGGTFDDDNSAATACADFGTTKSDRALLNRSVIAIGVTLAGSSIVLSLLLGFAYRRHSRRMRDKYRPYRFQAHLSKLIDTGILPADFKVAEPREISRKRVKLLDERIGEGAFGTVFKGLIDESSDFGVPEYTVAIKTLKADPSGADVEDFMREAAIMAQFNHRNVVSLVGVCTAGTPKLIILQLCEHGSLWAYLKLRAESGLPLELEAKYRVMIDVADGMAYLAGCRVVHRDLAARNVLLNADFVCKVSDFGMSREISEGSDGVYSSAKSVVPFRWTAPEVLSSRKFSTYSDVWSFGILCGEVFENGAEPYAGKTLEQVWVLLDGGGTRGCPAECAEAYYQSCLRPCFDKNPMQRPSFRELATAICPWLDVAGDGARDTGTRVSRITARSRGISNASALHNMHVWMGPSPARAFGDGSDLSVNTPPSPFFFSPGNPVQPSSPMTAVVPVAAAAASARSPYIYVSVGAAMAQFEAEREAATATVSCTSDPDTAIRVKPFQRPSFVSSEGSSSSPPAWLQGLTPSDGALGGSVSSMEARSYPAAVAPSFATWCIDEDETII